MIAAPHPETLARARRMASQGMSLDDVAKRTGVSPEVLASLMERERVRDLKAWNELGETRSVAR